MHLFICLFILSFIFLFCFVLYMSRLNVQEVQNTFNFDCQIPFIRNMTRSALGAVLETYVCNHKCILINENVIRCAPENKFYDIHVCVHVYAKNNAQQGKHIRNPADGKIYACIFFCIIFDCYVMVYFVTFLFLMEILLAKM